MKKAYLYLSGIVYDEQSKGTEDYGVITKRQVIDFILANQEAEELIVTIHSRGGDVTEGFAIYDALVNSGKKITTIGEGLVASIATVFFMAGTTRKLTENTDFFIHNPWGEPWSMSGFTADDYQKRADEIRIAEEKILNFYVQKTGADKTLIADYMKEQKTLSSDKALELKFATEVIKTNQQAIKAFLGGPINNKPSKIEDQMNKELKTFLDALKNMSASIQKAVKGEGASASTVEVELNDGKMLVIEAASDVPAVGDSCTIDGAAPADGDYTDKDGTVYSIAAGLISAITPKAADSNPPADNPTDTAALQAKIKALETENAALKNTNTENEKAIKELTPLVTNLQAQVTAILAGTGSNYTPQGRQADFRKPGKNEKTLSVAEKAAQDKIEQDSKKKEKSKSIWDK